MVRVRQGDVGVSRARIFVEGCGEGVILASYGDCVLKDKRREGGCSMANRKCGSASVFWFTTWIRTCASVLYTNARTAHDHVSGTLFFIFSFQIFSFFFHICQSQPSLRLHHYLNATRNACFRASRWSLFSQTPPLRD